MKLKLSDGGQLAIVIGIGIAVWAVLHAVDRLIIGLAGPFAGTVEVVVIVIGLLVFVARNAV